MIVYFQLNLLQSDIVGLDSEFKPSFLNIGSTLTIPMYAVFLDAIIYIIGHPVLYLCFHHSSILQVASRSRVFLFDLLLFATPAVFALLGEILTSDKILKVGTIHRAM